MLFSNVLLKLDISKELKDSRLSNLQTHISMKKQNTTPAAEEAKTTTNPAENEAKEVKFQPLAPEVQELITRLKQENASLQIKLQEQPQSLEDKIKFYQAKQENISKLTRLDGFAKSILIIGEEVQNSMGENEFTSDKFSFQVIKRNYSSHDGNKVLDINNPVLVAEVLDFALGKINEKRNQLQTLIEA